MWKKPAWTVSRLQLELPMGVYKGVPRLHFELLEELAEKVPVPLVLHGGSGTGNENISKACRMGICKVNLANDLYRAALKSLEETDMSGNGVYGLYPALAKGYREKVLEFIDVCGAENTAELVLKGGITKEKLNEERGCQRSRVVIRREKENEKCCFSTH